MSKIGPVSDIPNDSRNRLTKRQRRWLIAAALAFSLTFAAALAHAEEVQRDHASEMAVACARGVAVVVARHVLAAILDVMFTYGASTVAATAMDSLDATELAISCGAGMAGQAVADAIQ